MLAGGAELFADLADLLAERGGFLALLLQRLLLGPMAAVAYGG